jgi:hypothetical protein
MMLSLLIDGDATGCYSSRRIELATDDSVAFRFIACHQHPDHDRLATFRRRFRREFEAVFVQVLEVARENPLRRFGRVSLDGTKPVLSEAEGIHANASRHSALSSGHAETLEAPLKGEIQEWLALAEPADGRNVPEGMRVPEEWKRRDARLAAIIKANCQIEARAAERFAREQAADEAKLAARAAKAAARGRKPAARRPRHRRPNRAPRIRSTSPMSNRAS